MTLNSTIATPVGDVIATLRFGLEIEFGTRAIDELADRFFAAEEADFYWETRTCERYLGEFETFDDDEEPLDRVAIVSAIDAHWHVGICLVDGEGAVQSIGSTTMFGTEIEAEAALAKLR